MNNQITILYFSDIHVGDGKPENQGIVLDEFIKDVKKQIQGVKGEIYALIGGDLVFEADKAEQYQEFDKAIVTPLEELGIKRNHIVCVPGNHDGQQKKVAAKSLTYIPSVEKKYEEEQYNDLLDQDKTTTDKFSNFSDYVNNQLKIVGYNETFYTFDLDENWTVCCLNTSLTSFSAYEKRKDQDYLGIDTRSLQKWIIENHNKKKILLMHHPQSWLMEWASKAINTIIKKEFSLVLTGHTHDQDLLCNINGNDTYIHCQAPQLFTTKEDNTLGYCLININGIDITDIIYRQWSEKRSRFNPGSDFTEDESGIVRLIEPAVMDTDMQFMTSVVDDKVKILLTAKLNNMMVVYNDQPIVWVNRYLSTKRVDKMRHLKDDDMISEDELINTPHDIIVLSPAQYGLSCYGVHFLIHAWEKYHQFGIYVPVDCLKKNKLVGYLNSQLQEYSKDVDDVKWVVIDDWIVSRKDSKTFITLIKGKFPSAHILLLSPRIERYFKDNSEISIREEGFDVLFMAPLKRDGVRSIVKAFNNRNYIEEEDKVVKRVNDDIKDFNMHRTPLNCITLLEVFNNSTFQDNPVNRTEVIERVLRIIFDNHKIPSYRTSVPDMKDCQFVLGYFCRQLIMNNSEMESFTEAKFKNILNGYCDDNGITLDIDYLFEILVANQILTSYGGYYCFRFTYWVYYFAAMQMYNDDAEFNDFIIEKKNYIHYPEILEFYTGKDRKRKDAVDFMTKDLIKATQSVREKVGWPEELNLFSLLKCQQTEDQKEKLISNLDNTIKKTNVPEEFKDTFEDVDYDPAKPFDQSVRKFFDDYSISYLIQSIHIASKAFRNSDYVERKSKDALLYAILDSWKVFVQIMYTIAKPLAVHKRIGYGDTYFELMEETSAESISIENRLLKIIIAIPLNVMIFYKNDMYSDKNGKTILQTFERETDKIKKYLLACVVVMERPSGWDSYLSHYISQVGQNSYYLGNLKDLMLFALNYYDMSNAEQNALKLMIKRAALKLETGINNPLPKDLRRVSFVRESEE